MKSTLLILFIVFSSTSTFAQTISELTDKSNKNRRDIISLQSRINEHPYIIDSAWVYELNLISARLKNKEFEIEEIDSTDSAKIKKLVSQLDTIRLDLNSINSAFNESFYERWKGVGQGQPDDLDVFMVTFNSSIDIPNSKFYKTGESINRMFDKYESKRLPLRISAKGKLEAISSCNDISNIGICIPISKFNQIEIQSALRVVNGENIEKLIENLDDIVNDKNESEGLVFIRLFDLFEKAYHVEKKESVTEECCPEEEKDWRDLLLFKLCNVLQSEEGISITIKGPEVQDQLFLRSFGLGSDEFSNGSKASKIEPRQYVTIYEKDEKGSDVKPIWWLLKKPDELTRIKYPELSHLNPSLFEKFYPNQSVNVLDNKSLLEIRFDQEMLARNINFYGNISLAATLDKRPIEVSPYSMVGKAQKSYGVNNTPIKEISSHFLNLFIEADNSLIHYYSLNGDQSLSEEGRNDQIESLSEDLDYIEKSLRNRKENILEDSSRLFIGGNFQSEYFSSIKEFNDSLVPKNNPIIVFKRGLRSREEYAKKYTYHEPFEIAHYKLQFTLKELKDAVDSLKNQEKFKTSFQNELNYAVATNNNDQRSLSGSLLSNLERLKRKFKDGVIKTLLEDIANSRDLNKSRLDSFALQLKNISTDAIKKEMSPDASPFRTLTYSNNNPSATYKKFMNSIDLCIQYMDYFKSSGSESMNAFLSLSDITIIRFESIYQIIKTNYSKIPKEKSIYELQSNDQKNIQYLGYIQSIIPELKYLQGRLSKFIDYQEPILDKNYFENDSLHAIDDLFLSDYIDEFYIYQFPEDEFKYAEELITNYSFYQKKLANDAGKELFSRMLYATIDLAGVGAIENEILEVKVMWYNIDPSTSSAEEGIELSTAKFLIKKTGWHLEASESVMLIQRINEDLVSNNVSPSNFKPTAGASLLWSYHNDFRNKNGIQRFIKWLEPSFGLNVSYLDFSSLETYEIGAGPIMGLWQNRLFFNTGYNFSVKGQSPFYFGIGFSFYNVIEKMKAGGKLNSDPE